MCAHEWKASVANRTTRGSKCPNCKKLNSRGSKNKKWSGYGDIGGRQWHCINREADRRKLNISVTIEDIWEVFLAQERKCRFTGILLTMWGKKDGKQIGNACLDRIDSTKGFVKDNIQWIDKRLQLVKRNLTDAAFIEMCEDVAAYQALRQGPQVTPAVTPPSFIEWTSKI